MLDTLLFIEFSDAMVLFILALVGLVIGFFLTRASVRANKIVSNQEAMIWLLILQCKKSGATDEEIQKIKDHFNIK